MKTKKTKADNFVFVLVDIKQAKQLLWSKAIVPIYALYSDDSERCITDISEIKEGETYGFEAGFLDEIENNKLEIHPEIAEKIIEMNIFPIIEENDKFYIQLEK